MVFLTRFLARRRGGSRTALTNIQGNHSLLLGVYHGKRARSRLEEATMGRLALALVLTALTAAAQSTPDLQSRAPQTSPKPKIVVPAGTSVPLALTEPVLARLAKAGESVYAETAFPVVVNNQMAIPPGTYVQGQIDTLARPGWFSPHAQFQIHFTKIIFANGYTVDLLGSRNATMGEGPARADDVIAAVAVPYVQVSPRNDVLLDNGSQIEMILQVPLQLNAAEVAAAVRMTNPAAFSKFKSATRCVPT